MAMHRVPWPLFLAPVLALGGMHCNKPLEVKKNDYLLHADPETLQGPETGPVAQPAPPALPPPEPDYHSE